MKIFFSLVFVGFCSLIYSQEIRSVKITEIESIIAKSKRPLIINMWATWCKPCMQELPYFLEEIKDRNKKSDSIDVLLVSLDFKEAFPVTIRDFANKKKLDAPIVWLNETNADYFCPKIDAKWSGALPSTLFINNSKGYRQFIEGKMSKDEFKDQISKSLNSTSH